MLTRKISLLGLLSLTLTAVGCSGGADPTTNADADALSLAPGSHSGATKLSVPSAVASLRSDPYVIAGYLDVRHYGAKGDGVTDDTAAFQAALLDASGDSASHPAGDSMVVYVPPGNYVISKTITGYQACRSNGSVPANSNYGAGNGLSAPSLVGPASGARPTIILKDDTFTSPASPHPMVRMVNTPNGSKGACGNQWQDSTTGAWDILFNSVIRDIDFRTGKNAGAIGVEFYAAQMSYMQNVSVDATGGYIGILGAPATEVWTNIEVTGGAYGVRINDSAGTSTIAGLRLQGQSAAGLSLGAVGAITVAGFDITEANAAASAVAISSRVPQGATLSMFDGLLQTSSKTEPAIANTGDASIYLRDTYVQAPETIIANASSTTVAANDHLQLVEKYVHADRGTNPVSTATNKIGYGRATLVYENDVEQTGDVGPTFAAAGSLPTDLVQRHVPPQMPWAFDNKIAWVTDYGADPTGAADSTTAIRNAVNAAHANGSDEVFLPRGNYVLSSTVVLYPNTKFFGLPGGYAKLEAPNWNTKGALEALVQVGDAFHDASGAKSGRAIVSDVQFLLPTVGTSAATPTEQTYLYAIDWQTGESSVLNQTFVQFQYAYELKVAAPASRNLVQVRQGGGGRWWGLQLVGDYGPNGASGHMLSVTNNAPLTLYGSNPEHGNGASFYGFSNATDVRVLGMKTETGGASWLFDVESSDNIMVSGVNGDGPASSRVHESGNVDLNTLAYYRESSAQGDGGHPFVQDDKMGYPFYDAYALIGLGSFDDSPFPRCGHAISCVP